MPPKHDVTKFTTDMTYALFIDENQIDTFHRIVVPPCKFMPSQLKRAKKVCRKSKYIATKTIFNGSSLHVKIRFSI